MSKSVKHLRNIKNNDEYGTRSFLFLEACKKFDCTPVVDYFASKQNHVLKKYWTKEDDSFSKKWTKDGFINPPYSIVKDVMAKAYNEHKKHNITLLILTYNKTDTRWWHTYVENCPTCEVHFQKGRIKFVDKNGDLTKQSAPYPSVWIIYRGQK